MIFLREVPQKVAEGVASGLYEVTGSVVRDVATGRGVAFLQETGLAEKLLSSALQGVTSTLSNGLNPLSIVSVIQNQQIKNRLAEVQASLGLLQNLQIGTLAVSGIGLGVSVAGFAVMLKRLKDIQGRLDTLGTRIEAITADRRADERRKIFSDIRHNLEAVDTLGTRTSKVATAEAAEKDLARAATHLSEGFADTVETLHRAPIDLQALDALWTLAAAIRLCHEAGLRALFSIDELAAAEELARRRAGAFLDLSASLSPDAIARLHAAGAADWQAQEAARRAAMAQAGTFVTGLRESVTAVASQGELAQVLRARGIAGPDYIRELAEERQAPLLTLAA